jgi:hypothetical protein
MESKNIKLRIFTSQHRLYMQMLIDLRERIGWCNEDSLGDEVYIAPFILTCAAALECTLNDKIIYHFTSEDGTKNDLSAGFLSMNLKGKLSNIVSILTDGKFTINKEHKTYQALVELIRLRNMLVHNSSDFKVCEAVVITEPKGSVHIKIPDEVNDKLEDYTFGIKRPIGRFQDALEDMFEQFFNIYDKKEFTHNKLIVLSKNS